MLQIIPKKNPQNFSSNSSLEIGLLLETFIVHASQVLHKRQKRKKKVHASTSCSFTEKLNWWFALSSTQASHRTPTAAATTERCVASWQQLWENPSSRGWNFILAQQKKAKEKLQSIVTSQPILRQLFLPDACLKQMLKTKLIYQHGYQVNFIFNFKASRVWFYVLGTRDAVPLAVEQNRLKYFSLKSQTNRNCSSGIWSAIYWVCENTSYLQD